MINRIAVLGCGRWGSFHAWYADHIGKEVMLWGRSESANMKRLMDTRCNEYLELTPAIKLTTDLEEAIDFADTIIISIHSQALREFLRMPAAANIRRKKFILCMKGVEIGTGATLTEVAKAELGDDVQAVVWVGPGHVQEFIKGIPNCMVIAGENKELVREIVDSLASPLIRFYYGEDLIGTELGAAAKNVIGLAAGMLDGFHYASLKGALMARGTKELSRLVAVMGGAKETVYGLSHLGDYEATLFSVHSNNRLYGEAVVQGKAGEFKKIAEGVYTSEALMVLSAKYDVELPISRAVYEIVVNGKNPREELVRLFMRSTKSEAE